MPFCVITTSDCDGSRRPWPSAENGVRLSRELPAQCLVRGRKQLATRQRDVAAERLTATPKRRNLLGGYRHGRGQRDGQRIMLHLIDPELVMQVRAGRPPGRAHIAD